MQQQSSGFLVARLPIRGHYVGVGASGFQSFFLKDELMKSISECGFEHPSEGRFVG